jgi:hypothetical protein
MPSLYGSDFDYTKEEGCTILAAADFRCIVHKQGPNKMFTREVKWHEVEALINGEWLRLCRTTLMDDVCTGGYDLYESEQVARDHFIDCIRYGVRIKDKLFCCIDSLTDG